MTKKVRSLQRRIARNKVKDLQKKIDNLTSELRLMNKKKRLCCLINPPLCSDCSHKFFGIYVTLDKARVELNYAKSRAA